MSPSPRRGVLPGVQMFRLGWAGCFPVGSSPYQLLPFNKLVLNQFTAGVAPARNSSGCGKLARRNSFGVACPGTRGACPQRPMEVADPGLPHPAQHPEAPKESPGTAEEQPMDWGGTGRLLGKEMMGDSSMESPRSSWFRVFHASFPYCLPGQIPASSLSSRGLKNPRTRHSRNHDLLCHSCSTFQVPNTGRKSLPGPSPPNIQEQCTARDSWTALVVLIQRALDSNRLRDSSSFSSNTNSAIHPSVWNDRILQTLNPFPTENGNNPYSSPCSVLLWMTNLSEQGVCVGPAPDTTRP